MERKLDIVITMGGLGKRFRDAGYKVPKFMIKAKGRSLFELSIISLEGYKKHTYQYIFIVKKDVENNVEAFINDKCEILGIKNYKIIILDYLTDGQATTAMLAEKYWNAEHEILIYNIDTYVEANEMKYEDLKGDGFIPCFHADGDHWSFVRLDENDKVAEIREKVRISNNCTLGAYYFKSCNLYKDLYNEFYINKKFNGEKYVAPLYDFLLKKGGDIYINIIDKSKVHVLGTPQELEEYLNL